MKDIEVFIHIMLYDKNEVKKVNDKKVLHKVGKNWETISLALLMTVGGITLVNAHASANSNLNMANQANQSAVLSQRNKDNNDSTLFDRIQNHQKRAKNNLKPHFVYNPENNAENSSNHRIHSHKVNRKINSLETQPQHPNLIHFTKSYLNSLQSSKANAKNSSVASNSNDLTGISYEQNYGGSAASYHNDGIKQTSNINRENTQLSNYVNSLDAKFPRYVSSLKANVSNLKQSKATNQSLASSYSAIANYKNFSSNVTSLANQAGMSPSVYSFTVSYNYNNNSNRVASASNVAKQLNTVNSYAQKINNIQANNYQNPDAFQYMVDSTSAKDDSIIASTKLENAQMALNRANQVDHDEELNNIRYESAKADDTIALINNDIDNNYINSITSSTAYLANSANHNNNINAYDTTSANSQVNNYAFQNNPNADIVVNSTIVHSNADLHRVISDRMAMDNFTSYKSEVITPVSNAQKEVSIATNDYNSASKADYQYRVLGNNPTLDKLFGQHNYGLLNPTDYASASALVSGQNVSEISNIASSAENDYINAQVSAESYANSTNNYYVLTPSLASSYANNTSSLNTKVNSASNKIENFYNSNVSNNAYENTKSNLQKANSQLIKDNALAKAYSIHIYNYAPKHITLNKQAMLRDQTDYQYSNKLDIIPKNTTLNVNGIGLTNNGILRYQVNYNGQSGFITGNPHYVRNAYLFANKNNHVHVKAIRNIREYSSADFSNNSFVKNINVGKQFRGTVVAEPDGQNGNQNIYGGFTRIRLNNGNYITSNTKFINLINGDDMPQPQIPTNPIISFTD